MKRAPSLFIAFQITMLTLIGFLINSAQCFHWFILPVGLCGILISMDAIDWVRARLDIFDPIGVIGVLGVHFFFIAPLLHVYQDSWMKYITPPPDWRPWLGYMAILNCIGLLVYRVVRSKNIKINKTRYIWQFHHQRAPLIFSVALLVTFVMQLLVYQGFGGIQGYISSFEQGSEAFIGKGWLFMISESFPIILFIGFAYYARKKNVTSWWVLGIALCIIIVLRIFFGGLRGSRSNTIWGIFWIIGITHYWIRSIPRKIIYFGLPVFIGFMYIYGFYKSLGSEAFQLFQEFDRRTEFEERSGRTMLTALLGDLGRSDVQAFILYRLNISESDYKYAYGRTYIGAIAILIPHSLWPERPPTKVKEGTIALRGVNSYNLDFSTASNIYGLAGEAMLNFGFWGIPLMFAIWGLIVKMIRNFPNMWESDDTRYLLLPMLVNFCFILLTLDFDNAIFFIIHKGAVPFFVIFFSSKITKIR